MTERVPDLRPPARAATSPTPSRLVCDAARRRRRRAVRGRPGRAARHRPRHLSVRHLVQPGRRRGVHRRRRRARRTSTRSGASPRPTRPASGRARSRPSSTTSWPRSCASAAASSGRRPAAPRRCGWLDLVALRYAARAELAHRAGDHQARRALRASTAIKVCTRYRGAEGAEFDHFPYHQTVLHHATGEYERARRLDRGHRRVPDRGRPAPGRPRLPRVHRRVHRRPDRRSSASGPAATRTSG